MLLSFEWRKTKPATLYCEKMTKNAPVRASKHPEKRINWINHVAIKNGPPHLSRPYLKTQFKETSIFTAFMLCAGFTLSKMFFESEILLQNNYWKLDKMISHLLFIQVNPLKTHDNSFIFNFFHVFWGHSFLRNFLTISYNHFTNSILLIWWSWHSYCYIAF